MGLTGDFFGEKLERNQDMAYLNMNSLMDLSYYFGRDFRKRGAGRILNTASIVSFFPGPKQPVYYAVAWLGYIAMRAGKIVVTNGVWNKFLSNVFVRIIPYRLQPLIVDRSSDV